MTTHLFSRGMFALVAVATLLTLTGCETPARVINADKQGIIRVQDIDVQDFEVAAARMLESLYGSGALERVANKPAVVAFSRITNDTGEYFDTDLLTIRIMEQLHNSGKVVLNMTQGVVPRDPLAAELKEQHRIANEQGQPHPSTVADYTLTGKILKNIARAGDMRQATYTFQLMLTDPARGTTAWIAQRQITKQGTKPAIGL